ncbi:hypothetical protein [Glycomyces xiaoerkulensis]|uniref:hypothetical protein n=1 Tax=Glycomyces xiaoerkulensis TaxID=2038139 RepID=UPI001E5CF89E|nr:hypothetical protein [Glycomyces xiaoerkulensis]
MRRRTFFAAGLTAVSAAIGGSSADRGIENALFGDATAEPVSLRLLGGQVAAAERTLEAAGLGELNRRLPRLLSTARATWEAVTGSAKERAASLFSRALSVTSQQQIRVSRESIASVAADRAARYAELAGDPVAMAGAARNQAVVLRRAGSPLADKVMIDAAELLRAETALRGADSAGMYGKILASAAYTAAGHDDRDAAAEYLSAAGGAIEPFGDTPRLARADLDVFAVSCDRVLGDYGSALHHAHAVDLQAVPEAHERGRYWQDVGLAAHGRGRIDLAIEALAELDQTAPQYLHHRPWSRRLVEDLLYTREGGSSPLLHRLGARYGL